MVDSTTAIGIGQQQIQIKIKEIHHNRVGLACCRNILECWCLFIRDKGSKFVHPDILFVYDILSGQHISHKCTPCESYPKKFHGDRQS